MSDAQVERQLNIKTGVVTRLSKEERMYAKEAQDQEAVVKQYRDQGRDAFDIKKQEELLKDCMQMIPDAKRRLADAVSDLLVYMDGVNDATKNSDAYYAASEALKTAQNATVTT